MPDLAIKAVTRDEAVNLIRDILMEHVDSETSICKAAAEQSIFCLGFKRYNDAELRRKYAWIVKKRPGVSRVELERLANDWQVTQQQVLGIGFSCDVQSRSHDTCFGWDEFTNEQLANFYEELSGIRLEVE